MRTFTRFTALLLFLALTVLFVLPVRGSALAADAPSAPPQTGASSAALLDVTGNRFLLLQNADERRPMASTTKIMTALVVLERAGMDEIVTVPPKAVGVEGSSIYLFAGEQITVRTLLYALLLSSANDAAVALACHTAGSVAEFAAWMNARAAALGLQNTHFANPHGLHDEAHYTTARDLALLARAALQNEVFAEIVRTARYSAPQLGTGATRLFCNHNKLLRIYEGAVGIKTGYTKKSGRCLVSAAMREGLTLVAVTLNDGEDWRDHQALFDWGFSAYTAFSPKGEAVSLPVVGGTAAAVDIIPATTLTVSLPRTHGEITAVTEAPRFLFAGFAEGECVGQIVYYMDGKVLATLPLVTAEAVPRATRRGLLARLCRIFS